MNVCTEIQGMDRAAENVWRTVEIKHLVHTGEVSFSFSWFTNYTQSTNICLKGVFIILEMGLGLTKIVFSFGQVSLF